MTSANLFALLVHVRAESTAALAKLDGVDPDALPGDLRAEHEKQRRGRFDLLAMTEDDVIKLHLAACGAVGRELSAGALRGLLKSGH
jgi:predicted ATPase